VITHSSFPHKLTQLQAVVQVPARADKGGEAPLPRRPGQGRCRVLLRTRSRLHAQGKWGLSGVVVCLIKEEVRGGVLVFKRNVAGAVVCLIQEAVERDTSFALLFIDPFTFPMLTFVCLSQKKVN
jgi:hypothetical protein